MKDSNNIIKSLGHITIDPEKFSREPSYDCLPMVATRDFVLFPDVTFPIALGREATIHTMKGAYERSIPVGIVCQLDPHIEYPRIPEDVNRYGVVADVLQVIELPDNSCTAIVRSRGKIRILGQADATGDNQLYGSIYAVTEQVKESHARATDKEFFMLAETIKGTMMNIMSKAGNVPDDMKFNLENTRQDDTLINLIATHAPLDTAFKLKLLAQHRIKERAFMMLTELSKSEQLAELQREIQLRTKARIDENQRTAFLQHQMEVINEELNNENEDVSELKAKASRVKLSDEAAATFKKELSKLKRLYPQSPDYAVLYNYLDTLLSLPWNVVDEPADDIEEAEEVLNRHHYGLEKVKERIIEQVALVMNNPSGKAPILCLVGAPGVGKTSIGHSVAEAMKRKFQRISLGGMHDESEIRGHRRTYIGAMPGRIIEAIRRSGSSNPVLLLDEVDKMGSDFKSDPTSALLEVLDPEQNSTFHDNYLDVNFDLSRVMFIATANDLASVPRPLLDRMEIIDLPGYLLEEKVEIARRHLLPRIMQEYSLNGCSVSIPDDVIVDIIEQYTSESGVRSLRQQIAKIVRRIILQLTRLRKRGESLDNIEVTTGMVHEYLGVPRFNKDRYEGNDIAGVVTGLAWTAAGGEILYIESALSPSRQPVLELTGNLGNVMKESATIAYQWVKAHASALGIDSEMFTKNSLNIHVPEGAIPKDGPSAGITIVTSIVSTFKQVKVAPRYAMTGEITLRGRVLPVGGIKEKILAAKRAGISDIILCEENRKDVDDINERYLSGLTFHYVSTIPEVLSLALTSLPATH